MLRATSVSLAHSLHQLSGILKGPSAYEVITLGDTLRLALFV